MRKKIVASFFWTPWKTILMGDTDFEDSARDGSLALPNDGAPSGVETAMNDLEAGMQFKRFWTVRELKTWSTSFQTFAICIFMIGVVCTMPAMARGGHMHGIGGFGIHESHRRDAGGGERLLTPAYVLITVSKITDAEVFKAAMRDLLAAEASLAGRLAIDTDQPVTWEGAAPAHLVMIRFDNPDQAQAWKMSDAFKQFDAELHRSSESTLQLVQGLPTPAARGTGGRGGRGFDQKAFEPNVKEYDQMLNKMHGICKGC